MNSFLFFISYFVLRLLSQGQTGTADVQHRSSHVFLTHNAAPFLPRPRHERLGQVAQSDLLSPTTLTKLNSMLDDHLEAQQAEISSKWRSGEVETQDKSITDLIFSYYISGVF